ncbi:MAG: nitroreductase family protein [Thermoleophilia bacterium]
MDSSIIDLLYKRHASRAIATQAIPEEVVAELVEAARLAPSCYNRQPWRYIFMTTDAALALGRAALSGGNAVWASRAPLLIAAYSRKKDDCVTSDGRAYHQFDLGISVMSLMLMATERGLTARPMAGFDAAAVRGAFALKEEDEPLVMIAVGYPDEDESYLPEDKQGRDRQPRVRKDAGEIVRRS